MLGLLLLCVYDLPLPIPLKAADPLWGRLASGLVLSFGLGNQPMRTCLSR